MRCPCSLGWGYLLRGPIVFFQKFLKLASNNSPFAAQHVSCCQIGWVLVVTGVGYLRLLVYKFQNPIQDFVVSVYTLLSTCCVPVLSSPTLPMSAEAARKREEKAKATLDPTTHWAAPEVVNREAVPKILGIRPFLRRQPSLTLLLEP
ncbi:hypothetical protein F2Q69_00015553 [Brassica cretica]|uniref:Uncharacterized protein n=1 Tax=Brassica cretica TaxID=69181 RepID=A0A8S9QYN5_BRACR|nr:hypothetical protein F2Q69_00015553 [Brassica cretica]